MKRATMTKRVVFVALAVLAVSMFGSGTVAAPPSPDGTQPSAITCGDSAVCNVGGPALKVENDGLGAAIYGKNNSSRAGVKGRGNPGVLGSSYGGYGVKALSTNGVGLRAESGSNAAIWAQGNALDADLVLAGNSSFLSDGVISSDPDYPSSSLWIFGHDDVNIVLDKEDDESGQFKIYDKLAAGNVILRVEENGELFIADDLHLDTDGGFGEIYATGASTSRLWVYSNSYIDVHLDDNNDETQTCFRLLNGTDSIIWQQCETKGTTTAGSQAVAVETSSGSREMYTIGSPGLWFEDFGSAALVDGQATVTVDPLFAETVNLDVDYQVYLTPVSSEAVLLFVTEKTPAVFTVQGVTLDGKPASASFDYRIVGKRLNYENLRLEQVDLTSAEVAEP